MPCLAGAHLSLVQHTAGPHTSFHQWQSQPQALQASAWKQQSNLFWTWCCSAAVGKREETPFRCKITVICNAKNSSCQAHSLAGKTWPCMWVKAKVKNSQVPWCAIIQSLQKLQTCIFAKIQGAKLVVAAAIPSLPLGHPWPPPHMMLPINPCTCHCPPLMQIQRKLTARPRDPHTGQTLVFDPRSGR